MRVAEAGIASLKTIHGTSYVAGSPPDLLCKNTFLVLSTHITMRGSRGGVGGSGSPLEFAKLNIADITENEKISYFSYVCTSTVNVKQNQFTK